MIYRAKRRCVVCGIVHAGSEFTKEQLAARNRGKLPDKEFLKDNFDLISASKPRASAEKNPSGVADILGSADDPANASN
jgi:hypothetical protein